MIFQDPSGSLDPRKSVKELIGEPLKIYKACKNRDEYDARIAEIMETVGLDERYAESFSHELDGGRRQRIGIGRALAMDRSSSSATSRSLHWTFPFRHRS